MSLSQVKEEEGSTAFRAEAEQSVQKAQKQKRMVSSGEMKAMQNIRSVGLHNSGKRERRLEM